MTIFISNKNNVGAAVREYRRKSRQKLGYFKHQMGQALRHPEWIWVCSVCKHRMGQKQYETQKSYGLEPKCNWCYARADAPRDSSRSVKIVLKK